MNERSLLYDRQTLEMQMFYTDGIFSHCKSNKVEKHLILTACNICDSVRQSFKLNSELHAEFVNISYESLKNEATRSESDQMVTSSYQ